MEHLGDETPHCYSKDMQHAMVTMHAMVAGQQQNTQVCKTYRNQETRVSKTKSSGMRNKK